MTQEEAKQWLARQCKTTIKRNARGRSYCTFSGASFVTSLIGRGETRKAGFYYESSAPLDESSVMGPWLKAKLLESNLGGWNLPRHRSGAKSEGHVVEFYVTMDWGNPLVDCEAIVALYKRLKEFQAVCQWPPDPKVIRAYNKAHSDEIREYLRTRA